MNKHLQIELAGEPIYLLPQKAIYRPHKKQLVISDVHLGKAAHFRQNGLPLPPHSFMRDLDLLHCLIDQLQPESVLFLGDLFHSHLNREWLWFKAFLRYYDSTQFILIEGNHDILPEDSYQLRNLRKVDLLEEESLIFSHEPGNFNKTTICGHLHPGLRLQGIGRQTVSLPVFIQDSKHLILPAFGSLTGLSIQKREKSKRYFVVTGPAVLEFTDNLSKS